MTTKTKKINDAIEELKKEYIELNPVSPSHAQWCVNQISNAVKFEGGFIYEFTKPSIKKDFCFGAGWNGRCTDEEQESASAMVQESKNNSQYFINENFDESFGFFGRLFKDIDSGWNGIFAASSRYDKKTKRCYLVSEKTLLYKDEDLQKFYKLTDCDIENLKKALEEEKQKFLKRLNTYLKKYGLSKINSWSYISD